MSVSTDAMYNSNSRYLHKMYRIHFSNTVVLEVLKSNYLISSSILDESYKTSSSPFGDITSNELELSLLNENGIFNPKNTKGPYYSYIRRGIKIEAFIRPDEVDEWDPVGVFYVTDWNTSSNGMAAEVVANDKLYSILNAPVPSIGISRDVAFADFIADYFTLFDAEVIVDKSIDLILPYGFTSGYTDNRELLADLMIAAVADCFCLHDGSIVIRSKTSPRELRATITDDDQIISVSIKQSISTDYDSVSVTCNAMQESAEQNILAIEALRVEPGITTTELTKFSTDRVVSVKSIRTDGDASVRPISFNATADDIVVTLQGTASTDIKIDVVGTVLEAVSSIVSTEGFSAVSLDSSFVQTIKNANAVCEYTDRYINDDLSTLELSVRGNPKLQLGDKIHVSSNRYRAEFTGILVKAQYNYSGGLSCDITLITDMTQEV